MALWLEIIVAILVLLGAGLALLGFASSTAMAKFLLRGEVIE